MQENGKLHRCESKNEVYPNPDCTAGEVDMMQSRIVYSRDPEELVTGG